MTPTTPYWFNLRQGKAEPAGDNTLRLTAPNLKEAFIRIRQADNGRWAGAFALSADGPDVSATEAEFTRPDDAWGAAFELYRVAMVV